MGTWHAISLQRRGSGVTPVIQACGITKVIRIAFLRYAYRWIKPFFPSLVTISALAVLSLLVHSQDNCRIEGHSPVHLCPTAMFCRNFRYTHVVAFDMVGPNY